MATRTSKKHLESLTAVAKMRGRRGNFAHLPRILPTLAQVAEILGIVEVACQVADLAEVVIMA